MEEKYERDTKEKWENKDEARRRKQKRSLAQMKMKKSNEKTETMHNVPCCVESLQHILCWIPGCYGRGENAAGGTSSREDPLLFHSSKENVISSFLTFSFYFSLSLFLSFLFNFFFFFFFFACFSTLSAFLLFGSSCSFRFFLGAFEFLWANGFILTFWLLLLPLLLLLLLPFCSSLSQTRSVRPLLWKWRQRRWRKIRRGGRTGRGGGRKKKIEGISFRFFLSLSLSFFFFLLLLLFLLSFRIWFSFNIWELTLIKTTQRGAHRRRCFLCCLFDFPSVFFFYTLTHTHTHTHTLTYKYKYKYKYIYMHICVYVYSFSYSS